MMPKIATRVITRKGKDMIVTNDHRWCTIVSEDDNKVTVNMPNMEYDETMARITGHGWIELNETYVCSIPLEVIEDKRIF